MDHVSTLLQKVLHKRGLHTHATASSVVNAAQEWIHKNLGKVADQCCAQTFKDGTLLIACDSPIALQEMHMKVAELREFLQENVVPEIEIRTVRG